MAITRRTVSQKAVKVLPCDSKFGFKTEPCQPTEMAIARRTVSQKVVKVTCDSKFDFPAYARVENIESILLFLTSPLPLPTPAIVWGCLCMLSGGRPDRCGKPGALSFVPSDRSNRQQKGNHRWQIYHNRSRHHRNCRSQ